jgi:hypothetical protein
MDVFMKHPLSRSAVRFLRFKRLDSLLDECDLVAQNADYGPVQTCRENAD